jgi:5-methyltetrahydrofolate--homocysteine methyltransferase
MLDTIYQSVVTGESKAVTDGVIHALEAGYTAGEILNQALTFAMIEVGRRYEAGDYYIPDMLIAARAMKQGLMILKPHLVGTSHKPVGKVVIGTVKGDLHDIGKNLVGMMLEGTNLEVIDLGVDIDSEQFLDAVRRYQPDFLAMSSLLTTTMHSMGNTLEVLRESGLRDQVAVMVGGAPISQEYADEIGADIFGPDASAAARLAREWMERA